VCLWAFQAACSSRRAAPSNILLITVDTLRADHLGCYGYTGVAPPTIDALAREGVLFERAFAQVPLTWPSHVAILTGTYPFANGVQDFTGQPLAADYRTLAESLKAHGYATGAVVSSFVLDRSWGLDRGFDFHYDAFSGLDFLHKDLGLVDRKAEESVAQALGWLETHSHQPFFFWLHLFDPHSPYDPPEPFRSRYRQRPYDGEVAYVDSQLARLVNWLRSQPKRLYENTLIVFLSDHGESLGEHGEQEHGFFVYNATLRVPLILKPAASSKLPLGPGPSGAGRGRVSAPVETIAVAPAILELVGIEDPIQKQFQGTSLLRSVGEKKAEEAETAYGETYYPFSSFGWSPLHSLETSRYHYIEAPVPELYDLEADPGEKSNLAAQNPPELAKLESQLKSLLTRYQPRRAKQTGHGPSEQTAEKLRSLGYVAYRAPVPAFGPSSSLADPKAKLSEYQAILRATDAFRAGNDAAGRALLEKASTRDPKLYLIPFLLAEADSRQGHWPVAEREFQRCLELNPAFDQAMIGLARALSFQGKTAAAQQWLNRALALNEKNFRAWYELARTQLRESPDAASASLDKVLAIQPNFAPAWRDLALLDMQLGKYEAATGHLEKAAQLGLAEPATYNYLGISYSRTNRLDLAMASYRRALTLNPNFAEAHLNLGFVYERMGQATSARQEYDAACRLDKKLCNVVEGR
jgi:arylsulfatase A-like enzyme/Tfp pilus assembly protein PilF